MVKKFDGTPVLLLDKSHRPLSPYPKSLSEETVKKILNLKRRNPDCSYMEIWVKMHGDKFVISLSSILRVLKRTKEYTPYISNAKKKHNKK